MIRRFLRVFIAILLLSTVISGLIPPRASSALAANSLGSGSYAFQDRGNIIATYGSTNITFTDSNVNDGLNLFTTRINQFCTNLGSLTADSNTGLISIPHNTNWGAGTISGTLTVGIQTGQQCHTHNLNVNISNPNKIANSRLTWNGNSISTVPGQLNSVSFDPQKNATNFYFASNDALCTSDPSDPGAILLDANNKNSGTLYCFWAGDTSTVPNSSPIKNFIPNGYVIQSSQRIHIDGTPGSFPAGGGTAANTGAPSLGCTVSGISILNPLNWLLCGAISGMSDIIGFVDDAITSQLSVGTKGNSDVPNQIFCSDTQTCQAYHAAWSSFRDIALGLMAVAGLIILIAQAMGLEILDAYTIRKTLPRLLIAAVGISLSWQLMAFFVQLANDLGYGIRALIYYPFTSAGLTNNTITLNSFSANGVSLLGVIGGLALGPFGILSLAATGALALLVAFFVLVLRQIAIILLIILAPIAIIAYILPNTQNVYKLWWDSFSRALLMFPLIAGFLAAGHVFSLVALSNNSGNPSPLYAFAAFVAYFAPYFLIPATFSLAGSALRQIGGFVNNRSRGGFDRLRNFRGNQTKKRTGNAAARAQSGKIFRTAPANSRRSKINSAIQGASLMGEAGKNPLQMGKNIRSARERVNLANGLEGLEKAASFQPLKGDDNAGRAIMYGQGSKQREADWLKAKGYTPEQINETMGHINNARREMGQDSLMKAAFLSTATASTAWNDDPMNTGILGSAAMARDLEMVSGGNTQTRAQLAGLVKEAGQRSGRGDLNAPFAETFNAAQNIGKIQNNPNLTSVQKTAAINAEGEKLHDKILEVEGPGAFLGGKGSTTEALLPAAKRRIAKAARTKEVQDLRMQQYMEANMDRYTNPSLSPKEQLAGTVTVDDGTGLGGTIDLSGEQIQGYQKDADRKLVQTMAGVRTAHGVLGQVSQEKQSLYADNILSQPMPLHGFNGSVLDFALSVKDRPEYFEASNDFLSEAGRKGNFTPDQARRAAEDANRNSGMPPSVQGMPPSIA